MLLKKIVYAFILLTALLITSMYLQPTKKGKGTDTATKYELVKDWPQLPGNFILGNPTGIGIDNNQNIVVFHRAYRKWPLFGSLPRSFITDNTIITLDKESGKILYSWGSNLFIMPHGLRVDHNDNIWVTDVGLNQVFKFTHEGKLLIKLGEAKVAGNDKEHFNQPTDVAVERDGSFYVSDGYGNSRIIKFSSSGKYLFEWGTKGNKNGEFNIPHGIAIDEKVNVYVADRENNRIQVFDSSGKFLKKFDDNRFGNICAVSFGKNKSKLFAADDLSFLKIKHRGSDVFIFDTSGNVQTRFGRSGFYDGPIGWFHDMAIDNDENIYIGDILNNKILKFKKVSSR
jgi:peptidylamidoglycolate lyase